MDALLGTPGATVGEPVSPPLVGAFPVYLQTAPDASFAMLHAPARGQAGATGVILCPPLGWDEECTYRARRHWAQALSEAGHPALRVQLPGTGDSVGSLSSADRLGAWTASVAAGAAWLRVQFGCERICALGIGFGGMLAWLAAAQGAPIDDLVLWGVPVRGRRLIRELRAAAKLDIDYTVSGAAASEAQEPEGGLLDEGGQLLSGETVAALGAIDLSATALPEPGRRRVLLFERTGSKADRDLVDWLRAAGAQVSVQDGNSFGAMMQYVQHSVAPRAAIAHSIAWLQEPAGEGTAASGWDTGPPQVASRAVFEIDGVRVRETPTPIELAGGTASVIVTEPVDAAPADLCVVFFSGGADRRTGPNRLWVSAARRWAARGVSAVRVDPPGIGDSEGEEGAWSELHTHYATDQVESATELLSALERGGLPARFVLVGFCSGAYRALHIARRDERVVGVITVGLPFFHWTWWSVNVRDSWLAKRPVRAEDSALKLRLIAAIQRCLRTLRRAHHVVVTLGQVIPNRAEHLIGELTGRGVELVFLLKGHSYAYEQLHMPRRRARLRAARGLTVRRLPGDDHRFRPPACQQSVARAIDETLSRLLAPAPPLHRATLEDEASRPGRERQPLSYQTR